MMIGYLIMHSVTNSFIAPSE